MICENPFTPGGTRAHKCGSCVPCRIGNKMVWKTRNHLEALGHSQNSFVTLTYRDDALVYSIQARAPTLIPSDLRNWLKRFRKAIEPSRIRFYAAGEYSPRERPHYHLIIFGYAGCHYGRSRYSDGRTIDCCSQCDLVRDTWDKGIIETQPYTPEHGAYVAGYVMKKMTSKHDTRLNGRYPEFSRQSNQNGGIGITAVPNLARVARTSNQPDVPGVVRIDGKIAPIGRYLKQKTRLALGCDKNAPQELIDQVAQEMQILQAQSRTDPVNITLKKQLVSRAAGKIASIKARAEMSNSRRKNGSL